MSTMHKKASPGDIASAPLTARVIAYVSTSVDDLRSSLHHEHDVAIVRAALSLCEQKGQKTKAKLLTSKLRQLCAKSLTLMTLRFADAGQDFLEWDLDANGCVIDSRPFQASTWVGMRVIDPMHLCLGQTPAIVSWTDWQESILRYPIVKITNGGAK